MSVLLLETMSSLPSPSKSATPMAKIDRTRKRSPKDAQTRKRNCLFCREKIEDVDYKNTGLLRRFVGSIRWQWQAGWKAAGVLFADGTLAGSYDSNEQPQVTYWYTRGVWRCSAAPRYYLIAENVQDQIDTPERVAPHLEPSELSLYTLIWNRFVASQMAPAVYDQTAVDIPIGECLFRANGQVMKFDGFMRVYIEGVDEKARDGEADAAESDDDRQLPRLAAGERLKLHELTPEQHFTQPPPRFSQATLIKEMEEQGIGRPSTYASVMGVILEKEYVIEDESRRLRPTELGMLVTELLVDAFPDIFNVEFTASMEEVLDGVEEGKESWVVATRRFYDPFTKDLEHADEHMRDVKREEIPTDFTCERCSSPMVIRWGRRGEFIACKNYPECRNTKNFTRGEDGSIQVAKEETIDRTCPLCGKPMQIRFGRFGKFVGCTGYPDCKAVQPLKLPEPIGVKCPDCAIGDVVGKYSRKRKLFYSCNRYPDCKFSAWDRPIAEPCPMCGGKYLVEKVTKRAGAEKRFRQTRIVVSERVFKPAPLRIAGPFKCGVEVGPKRSHDQARLLIVGETVQDRPFYERFFSALELVLRNKEP